MVRAILPLVKRKHAFLWLILALSTVISLTFIFGANTWSTVTDFFPLPYDVSRPPKPSRPTSDIGLIVGEGPKPKPESDLDYPPAYWETRKAEENLPQHNLSLPFPEGRNGRYVKFTCAIQQLGWNNVLNELLMNTFLAYKSNRAYVFSDYVWKREYYPWSMEKATEWPPRTPLSALISGPTVGASWGPNDPAPRSVSEKWYEVVCPPEKRRIINTREVKPKLVNATGDEIFATWQKILLDAPEQCIEIQPADFSEDGYPQVFDLWLWGSWKVLSLWEAFSKSPVSQLLGTTSIVERQLNTNIGLFTASGNTNEVDAVDPFSRMLAIHLRRGDFKQACVSLSDWNSTFYSWNLHDFLPDKFTNPPGGGWGKNTPENEALYMKHCLPSDQEILKKIRDSRADYLDAVKEQGRKEDIDVLYLLTNDESDWLEEVKAIMKTDGWKVVATSRDLKLDVEGKDVGMAVDMEIARKASVFIGNGWSSFTSNVLHRRLVDGRIPMSNRFY